MNFLAALEISKKGPPGGNCLLDPVVSVLSFLHDRGCLTRGSRVLQGGKIEKMYEMLLNSSLSLSKLGIFLTSGSFTSLALRFLFYFFCYKISVFFSIFIHLCFFLFRLHLVRKSKHELNRKSLKY